MPEIVPLSGDHRTDGFTCGNGQLDSWLTRALDLQGRDAIRVFAVVDGPVVLAYSGLVVGSVASTELPIRARGGLREIPVLLLSKLAVATSAQGTGAGSALLGHAAQQALKIRELAGVRMLAAHPIDESARAWYEHKGMQVTSDRSLCYARIKDLVD